MAIVNSDVWAFGGPLAPGAQDHWFQDRLSYRQVRWFMAHAWNNPGREHRLEIPEVFTLMKPDGNRQTHVIVRNLHIDYSFYVIFFAETGEPAAALTADLAQGSPQKVIAIHDKLGNITSFGIPNPMYQGIGLQPPSDKYATEVDMPEIKDFAVISAPELEQVASLLRKSKIDLTGKTPRLVQ